MWANRRKKLFIFIYTTKKRPDEKRERESNKHLEINGDDEGRNEEVKGKRSELKQNRNWKKRKKSLRERILLEDQTEQNFKYKMQSRIKKKFRTKQVFEALRRAIKKINIFKKNKFSYF